MRDGECRDLYKVVCSDITDCPVEAALISHKITSMRVRSQPQILPCFYLSYYVSNFVPRFINHAMCALEYFIVCVLSPGRILSRSLLENYEISIYCNKNKSVMNWNKDIGHKINKTIVYGLLGKCTKENATRNFKYICSQHLLNVFF